MFLFKKLFSRLFFPVPLCLEILLLGLVLLCLTKRQKTGKAVVFLGVLLLAAVSTDWLPDRALVPLESRHPVLERKADAEASVDWIVVLSGGLKTDPKLPMRLRSEDSTLARLVEGIVQYRSRSSSRLLLSGGGEHEPSAAEVMAETAKALGVPDRDIVLETRSRDTADQAELVRERVGGEPFMLVTSASHMPRAVYLFRQQGLRPVPAPAHFLNEAAEKRVAWDYFPSHEDIGKTQRAVYEYMGLAWSWITGQWVSGSVSRCVSVSVGQ